MLYEMLTGEVPFVSSNIIETFIRHAQEPPPLLTVADLDADTNRRLQAIVHRCLAKDKGESLPIG
jgi:serine/threonine protein kinase